MTLIRRYANFSVFFVVMVIVGGGAAVYMDFFRAMLAGFDCGALVFLLLMIRLFGQCKPGAMRTRSAANAPDHAQLIMLGGLTVAIVLTAVGVELAGAKDHHGDIGVAATSLVLAWLFANTLFALHYAHLWYLKGKGGPEKRDAGGLDFPGDTDLPDYWDFAYFSFVLGMTFQVSDVQVTGRHMRRLALLHGMLAFLFNIAVVALSVNLFATALGG